MIKLFRFLFPYLPLIIIVFILIYFQSLFNLYLPDLMSDIIKNGVAKYENGIFVSDIPYIWKVGKEMLLIALASSVLAIIASLLSSHIANGFGKRIRKNIFTKVEGFSLNEFDKIGTATLITRSTNDITQVQNVTLMMLRMMVMAPMMIIGGIVMAVRKDVELTKIFLVSLPVIILSIFFVGSKGIPLFRKMQVKLDKLNLVLREYLTGIRVVRAFNRTNYEKQRFTEANKDLTDTAIRVNRIMALLWPILLLVMNYTMLAIIWYGGIRIDKGLFNVGDLMAFIQYAMQIMFSLLMVSMMFVMIPRAQASAIRINEVLDIETEINDSEVLDEETGKVGFVEFKNVTFSYPGAETPALSNISFKCNPGEVTAIIGGTGSGKSTLISLLPRFYDVQEGEILVDDIDIRNMSQEKLRAKIGFVPQKAVLFTGTIAENIRYGKEDATIEEVIEACKTAQAYDFISSMELGFDSLISQGGTNFSGGQKQRLSIARALVRKPEIYVFDDSFSALDFKTDAKLRESLRKETKNATVLIVAQRVSTVMDADKIIVLEEGKIASIGNHKELMNRCEVYREIVTSQLSEEELA